MLDFEMVKDSTQSVIDMWRLLPAKMQQNMVERLLNARILAATRYYPSVCIDVETKFLDLSAWSPKFSAATWSYKYCVRRVDGNARYFAQRIATSGSKPTVESSTHKFSILPVQRCRRGGPEMDRYDAFADISAHQENDPFKMDLIVTNCGGFSDPQGEWAAVDIAQPTARLFFDIKFPKGKATWEHKI